MESTTASGLKMKGAEKEFSDAGGATQISTLAPRWSQEGLPIDSATVMTVSSSVEGSWKSPGTRSSLGPILLLATRPSRFAPSLSLR